MYQGISLQKGHKVLDQQKKYKYLKEKKWLDSKKLSQPGK